MNQQKNPSQNRPKYKQMRIWWDKEFRAAEEKHPTQVDLLHFLKESGDKLNCFFAIEMNDIGGRWSALQGANVSVAPPPATIADLIKKLQNDLESVAVGPVPPADLPVITGDSRPD